MGIIFLGIGIGKIYMAMQRLKILHIIKSLGRGGAEMLLPETLKLHDKNKFEFHYIYFLPWKDQMVLTIEKAGGKVKCFHSKNNLSLLLKSNEVIDYCMINKIDLIHCHLPWSGFLGRIIFKKTKIPVIYTEHNIQERYHFATKFINNISYNYQCLVLGVSKDVTRSINENINPKIPVRTILNGVNTNYFRKDLSKEKIIREKLKIPLDAIVVGNIAVFREQKCIPDWINAFKKIIDENPKVYGLLVGAGPKEEEVKKMIKDFNIQDRIILPGLQEDTVLYFSAMDIFMMSSEFEGLPIALLEAMSMSCAIVSTKAGGVVEAIRDNEDGMLCEVGDWMGLAKSVEILLQDNKKLNSFKIASRTRVVNSFSLSNMVSKLENIYSEEVVESRKK